MESVTLYLTVVVSPNTTSYPVLPINATNLQSTEVNESPPSEAMKPSMAQDSTNTARSIVATGSEILSPPTDRLPSPCLPPAADRQAGMSPTENALHGAGEAMATINLSKTWEGALERIKWVMDTASSVAEVR